jgi:PAS domain S-box-containing protein
LYLKTVRDADGQPIYLEGIVEDVTDRKRAEDSLRHSEIRYREMYEEMHALFAAMTDLVFILNSEGRYLKVVDTSPALLYKPSDELLGKTLHEVFPKEQADFFLGHLMQALNMKRSVNLEYSLFIGDKEYCFNATVSPISDEKIMMVARDITERKKAEEAWRESEEQFRVLTQNLVSGVALINELGEISTVNKAFLRLFNLGEDVDILNINSRDWSQWQVFDEAGGLLDVDEHPVRKAARTRTAVRDVLVAMQCPGRTDRNWILISAEPILDAQGNLHRLICTYHDITERKQVEEALRASNEKLQKVLEIETVGVMYWDLTTGCLVDANNTFLNMMGYSRSDVENRNLTWQKFTPPEYHEVSLAEIRKFQKTGRVGPYEKEYFRKDGTRQWLLFAGSSLGGDQCVEFCVDISNLKQAEEALVRLNETLEQRVVERTKLAEDRAMQLRTLAVKMIEVEERERRRFADLLHDDLQQMLASARFQLKAVSNDKSGDPVLENVSRILEESLAKSKRLAHELSPPIMHYGSLSSAMEWLAGQMNEQFGLNVHLEVENSPKLENSPIKVFVFRAVKELLFNIVKHAGVKNAKVSLSGKNDHLDVIVSDQGKGFDKADLDRTEVEKGFGLLSIRERARYIGGDLKIESEPGRGSRIRLKVPIQPAAGESVPVPSETPFKAVAQKTPSRSAGLRVLFVDDHKVMRQGLIRLISSQPDIQVAGEAANGKEAVELALQLHPDLILMDISMPEMDGIEATQRIKAELPDVRVIGLSMYDDEHTAESMRKAGAEAFINKSVSSAVLLKAIYGSK